MNDERPIIVLLIFVAVVAWIFVISSFTESYKDVQNTQVTTVYDSPSNKLKEIEAPCKECGQLASGINGEVVCRNKNCSLYGVPVKLK